MKSINVGAGFCFFGGWNFSKSLIVDSTFIREMRVFSFTNPGSALIFSFSNPGSDLEFSSSNPGLFEFQFETNPELSC
jgi:hypothetical protein